MLEERLRRLYDKVGGIDVYYFAWSIPYYICGTKGFIDGIYLCDCYNNALICPEDDEDFDIEVGDEIEGQEDITFKNQVEICKYFKELCIKIGFVWKGKYRG